MLQPSRMHESKMMTITRQRHRLQSSHMHESKRTGVMMLTIWPRCNPRACMNRNKQKPPRRAAPQKLQSSHMHESKLRQDGQNRAVGLLQSSHMRESKYILIHDFEFSKNPRACMNQKTKSCAPSPAALQSSHIHESKSKKCCNPHACMN